jgi:hypothetical protein
MAWSGSSIFSQYVEDLIVGTVENSGATSMSWTGATTVKVALFDNTITPDNDVAAASAAYLGGVWTATPEQDDGTNWDAGGEPVTGRVTTGPTTDVVAADAADTPQSGASCTLANVHGDLVYSDSITTPVADQAFCYNYFGGPQSVTAGNFTVVWHANGVFRFTMTQA